MWKRKHRNYRSYRGLSYRGGNGQSKRFTRFVTHSFLHAPPPLSLSYLRNSLDRFYLLLRFSMIITNKRSESVFFEHRRSFWSLHLVTISGRLLCVSTLEMRWMLRMAGGREGGKDARGGHTSEQGWRWRWRGYFKLVSSLDSTPRVIRWF